MLCTERWGLLLPVQILAVFGGFTKLDLNLALSQQFLVIVTHVHHHTRLRMKHSDMKHLEM